PSTGCSTAPPPPVHALSPPRAPAERSAVHPGCPAGRTPVPARHRPGRVGTRDQSKRARGRPPPTPTMAALLIDLTISWQNLDGDFMARRVPMIQKVIL